VLTLYQAEWCPYSHRIRQRLTELGLDFVAKQVAADKDERDSMRDETGGRDGIPLLVADDGTIVDEWTQILRWLDANYDERPDARRHREKLLADAEERDPRSDRYPRT
jgi:glutathione S-transferase